MILKNQTEHRIGAGYDAPPTLRYKNHRFPGEIIRHGVCFTIDSP
jgi:hypothetical protein